MEWRGEAMTYSFGDVEIDGEGFRVFRAGEPVRLEPKAVELLLFLASNPGRLVSKSEIQEAVWRETSVTENALTRLVAQIRKALGDDARDARYIETVPTRGYRFLAPPATAPEAPAQAAPSPSSDAGERARRSRLRAAAAFAVVLVLTAAAVSFATRGGSRSFSAPTASPVQVLVSTSDGVNVFPSFSPDGSALAYATLRNGSMEVVVRALAPGAREVAVTSDGMQNVEPAISPDGRLLAYHSVVRGGIWVVPALGGVPRRLTSFGSRPDWSPDGSQLVFQGQSWVGSTEGSFAAGEGSTLWVVGVAGGEPRRITSVEQTGPGGHGSAAWSPSGRIIAFVAGGKVFAVRPDGTGFLRTADGPWINEVAWVGDGETQIWTGARRSNWYVWRVKVDPGTGLPTGEPQVLATGGDRGAAWTHPVSSPDGKRVAYVTFSTWHELMAQRVTSEGSPVGDPVPLVRGIAGRKQPPMYSPDARRLAFAVVRPGAGQALWLIDDGAEPRLLVEREDIYATPQWYPDSRHLGFNTSGPEGRGLWTVDVETGDIRRRGTLPPQMASPVLSPDGMRLVGHGPRDGVLNLWTASVDGGEARPLTADREGLGWPVWSPDGTMLAVEMIRGGDTRVGLMPSTGGPPRELTSARGQSWPYSFSPDGRRVAFAGQRDGIWNVYWVPVDGGEERRITSYASPAHYVRYCAWSPRGDRIAYEFAESMSSVWVTELPAVPR